MYRITDFKNISAGSNKVFVNPEKSSLIDSSFIEFTGENNILFIEDGVTISHSSIHFYGSRSVVYLSESRHKYILDLGAHNNTAVFFGKYNIIWNRLSLIASEGHNVIIGGDSLISWGGFIRTADPHLIYDTEGRGRINPSKSVFLGDHIWFGQSVTILKGTVIGSGSIIGADSVVAGKKIPSNASAAGNPAKIIKEGIFFSKENVNSFTKETAAQYAVMDKDDFIYSQSEDTIDIPAFDMMLQNASGAEERLDIIMKYLAGDKVKNRFFVAKKDSSPDIKKQIKALSAENENLASHVQTLDDKIILLNKQDEENAKLNLRLQAITEQNAKLSSLIRIADNDRALLAEQTKKIEEQNALLKAQLETMAKQLDNTQKQLEDTQYHFDETTKSFSYRLGSALTAVPRKIRGNKKNQ